MFHGIALRSGQSPALRSGQSGHVSPAGLDDPRMRKTTTPRGSLAGLLRALAAVERKRPGTLKRILGE